MKASKGRDEYRCVSVTKGLSTRRLVVLLVVIIIPQMNLWPKKQQVGVVIEAHKYPEPHDARHDSRGVLLPAHGLVERQTAVCHRLPVRTTSHTAHVSRKKIFGAPDAICESCGGCCCDRATGGGSGERCCTSRTGQSRGGRAARKQGPPHA